MIISSQRKVQPRQHTQTHNKQHEHNKHSLRTINRKHTNTLNMKSKVHNTHNYNQPKAHKQSTEP